MPDAQDRHLLAVVAVWAIVFVVAVLGCAIVAGLAVRLFGWVVTG